ncbi:MAG: hypothetical protein KJP20_12190 [Bacteroidia bacterium]|nr:hypothetical protein [Bacteroidia bacterium]NND26858.1 hypothetical protein [Flavobacteriaceae bacterium]NNK61244.1 hypothetical protein [Flavobacteriaceae bacterium]RZW52804.1 MAG: hypothetical protein EX263_06740 [Flavobacteriaceae bacterium]
MLKKYAIALTLITLFVGCQTEKKENPFLITNQSVGVLTDSTEVKDLERLFFNDSIVRYVGGDEFTGNINDIEIYETSGNLLMVLTPFEALDSTSTIKTIRIADPRFKTSEGLNKNSIIKDIIAKHKISNVQNTLSNLIVSLEKSNVYFIIDKKELPPEMRYDMNLKIDPIQIPDQAKIKHFMVSWY